MPGIGGNRWVLLHSQGLFAEPLLKTLTMEKRLAPQ